MTLNHALKLFMYLQYPKGKNFHVLLPILHKNRKTAPNTWEVQPQRFLISCFQPWLWEYLCFETTKWHLPSYKKIPLDVVVFPQGDQR